MNFPIKAVIFDMDGVIVDSEPLWRRAMIKGFNAAGIPFTEDDCRKTTGTRFKEVVQMWLSLHQKSALTANALEKQVMELLLELIELEGKAMDGVLELMAFCKTQPIKIGLATSSSHALMKTVLKKLNLESHFDIAVSAEFMTYGKPHPEVFLHCAEQLGVSPINCLVIEDSVNGCVAAKAATMKVIAVPDPEHKHLSQFALADYKVDTMAEALPLLKSLFL